MRLYRPLQPPIIQQNIMDSNYKYNEYLPSSSLMRYVACYWTVDIRASDTSVEHRVIPDGCLDIIFDLRPSSVSSAAFITGFMPGYEVMRLSEDRSLFGIRFYLETVHRVLKQPASSFVGDRVLLEDVWGMEGRLWSEHILSAGVAAASIIPIVESKLKAWFAASDTAKNLDSVVQSGMEYMYASRGNLSIGALADKLSYSERHLRRTFQQALGISPKELLHIIKFQSVLLNLVHFPPSRFAEIAAQHGYYDQSHLIHSFNRYYGLPPSQIFKTAHSNEAT
ncbi:DUF6597 domain-containing transcriptional factor [Paenibacillus allorhizosphaerae]|uniref:HTH araC/xylS-type domain-containing protein n=1 Tax=Paenibacillus allorhizosphaerae TaxID=2849866 RepID=A0ABN7TIQ9_9BACL|nr:helix-turn-helix transcriptional regulator [Paenibacillus allorhizosphaerae]CAG7633375.1 hypothetical protein PAECIP111802_01940 [Paenibacillus allorhizosphaerae]